MTTFASQYGNRGKSFQGKSRSGYLWGLVIFILFCQLLGHTWVRNQSTQAMVDISRVQAHLSEVRAYNRALGIERGRLKSEARVIAIAKNRLGLIQDTFHQIVYLDRHNF